MAKVKCEISSILGELSDINSRNTQKVVAAASWNDREETINIREYNPLDKMLLKGISLTAEEAEELVYVLLKNVRIEYDADKAMSIIKLRHRAIVDIEKMINALDLEDLGIKTYVRNKDGFITIKPRSKYTIFEISHF